MYTCKEKAVIFIDGFINLEYKHKRAIINLYDSVDDLFSNPNKALNYVSSNLGENASNAIKLALNDNFLNQLLEKYFKRDIKIVTEVSKNYPKRLLPLPYRPICLYYKGDVTLLNSENIFAIVGSRKTDKGILKAVEDYSTNLVNSNVCVVTGIASGVDLSAIKGGMDSGRVISVMACGSDFWNNEANRDYVNKISNNGLVISEYSPEVSPRGYFYPIRNRIIAGLCDGVLIASGNYKSGAKYTSNYALDYGREVFAFPYGINSVGGELCNSLIKDGARLVTDYSDIAEVMGYDCKTDSATMLEEKEMLVYTSILSGNSIIDDIIDNTKLRIFELMPIITTLEIKGLIINEGGNQYIKTTKKI